MERCPRLTLISRLEMQQKRISRFHDIHVPYTARPPRISSVENADPIRQFLPAEFSL